MDIALTVIAAYLLGSVSFAIVVSKLMRFPTRAATARRIRARPTCCARRKAGAILTLVGDAAKGWFAVWLALLYVTAAAPYARSRVPGHLFRCITAFRGGRAWPRRRACSSHDWRVGLGTLATWLIISVFVRYSSLRRAVSRGIRRVRHGADCPANEPPISWHVLRDRGAARVRHKENIARFIAGTESRIGAEGLERPSAA